MKALIVTLSYWDTDEDVGKLTLESQPGQSFFMILFEDVIDELSGYYWVCPDTPVSEEKC